MFFVVDSVLVSLLCVHTRFCNPLFPDQFSPPPFFVVLPHLVFVRSFDGDTAVAERPSPTLGGPQSNEVGLSCVSLTNQITAYCRTSRSDELDYPCCISTYVHEWCAGCLEHVITKAAIASFGASFRSVNRCSASRSINLQIRRCRFCECSPRITVLSFTLQRAVACFRHVSTRLSLERNNLYRAILGNVHKCNGHDFGCWRKTCFLLPAYNSVRLCTHVLPA